MSAPRVTVDFAGGRRRLTLAGGLLLLLGVAALGITWVQYRSIDARRAGLALKVQAATHRNQRDPAQELRATALSEESARVAQELAIPWTKLLAELEAASRDAAEGIAVLSVEPDHAKHHVRITGESRDLTRILAYVQRLQSSALLRYPMLESHDLKTDDPQRPVRFAMTAEWSELP
jgi:Tfp pilus assembly protein PilN